MHAASVHPEPGSNSLKKLYIKLYSESDTFHCTTVFSRLIPFFRALDVCSILWIYLLIRVSKELSRFVIILYNLSVCFLQIPLWKPHCFVLNLSLVVQFSRTILLPLALRSFRSLLRDSYIISYSEPFVKGFCKSFLSFFETLSLCFLAWRDLYIISYFLEFVKRFCKSFLRFFFVNLSGSVSWPRRFCLSRSQL